MNKYLLCLALALVAALAVPSHSTVTESTPGNSVNSTIIMPAKAPSFNCVSVRPSTHTPTLLIAAPTAYQRTSLFIQNVSSSSMVSGRGPDIVLTASSALAVGTAGAGPALAAFRTLPGHFLSAAGNGTISLPEVGRSPTTKEWYGSGTPTGAIYAIAESSGATVDVKAQVTACEGY